MGIKVIAIEKGYYGQFREIGDTFEVADEEAFATKWMEKLDGKRTKRIADNQPQTTGNNPIGANKPNPEFDIADLS